MLRFIVAPDSFKGSLSSAQAGKIIAQSIWKQCPDAIVTVIPMADGGEGTIEALTTAANGYTMSLKAAGPFGDPTDTYIGIIKDDTVILEIANIAGLPMVPEPLRNPMHTTTQGLGELIIQALDLGYRKLVIGLGGSATNDGGMGMLRALGAQFLDEQGNALEGYGQDLLQVHHVDYRGVDARLQACELLAASDVSNPLCGQEGASYIFAPQKGADTQTVKVLDQAMGYYADLIEQHLDVTLQHTAGAGAAGGLGFALLTLGFRMLPGAQLIEQFTDLEAKLPDADWVITGEGRSDGQSLYGKLPIHIATRAQQYGVPAILISGSLGPGHERLNTYFAGCFSIINEPSSLADCMNRAEELLGSCATNVIGLLNAKKLPPPTR